MTSSSHAAADVPAKGLQERASQAYARESRESMEERLILEYLPLVRHIVQKIAAQVPSREDTEDLISAGTVGLVRAAKAFDPARDVEFKTYAYIRIRGAVIDELRERSFVPTGVHNRIRQVRRAYEKLTVAAGRPPNDEELAAEAGLPLRQLYRILEEARNQHFLSIHGLSEERPALGSFLPPDGAPTPHAQVERKELLEGLARAIRELPERERTVILLYYERDLTMKESAQVLGITESRVSQLHASALFKLSMKLRAEP